MHPIYILLDTTDGASLVLEAANKWIWELNSPISPGAHAKIISSNIDWNYTVKDVLYFSHQRNPLSGKPEYVGLYTDPVEAQTHAGQDGEVVMLEAKRYGHIVLYLKDLG